MKISEIKNNPNNPRLIKDDKFEKLKKSIEQFPQMMELRPIVIDEDGVILGGNMRFQAIKALKMKDIPDEWVKRAEELTEEQKKEFVIKDNAGFGDWDWDSLANEWDAVKLADWGLDVPDLVVVEEQESKDAEPQIDKAAELNKKWKVKSGDLWQIGEHRLLCTDCTGDEVVQKLFVSLRADCVFTSPPYAVGIDYGDTYDDTIENLRAMLPRLSSVWKRIVCDGGFAVVNFGDVLSGKIIAESESVCEYPMALEYWPPFRAEGWALWARRVWCKPGAAVGSSRHCIGTNRAASNFEHLWTWKLPGTPPVDDQISGEWPSQAGWFDTTHENKLGVGLKDHGAGMPVGVASRGIHWHSRAGHIVHEPFGGTGTTIVACQNLSRKCYATEINPNYCAVILERMQTAFPELEIKRIDG